MQKRLLKQLKDELNILEYHLKNLKDELENREKNISKILERNLDLLNNFYKKKSGKNKDFEKYTLNLLINMYKAELKQEYAKYYKLQSKIFELETRIYNLQNPDDDIVTTERCKVGCNILSPKQRKRSPRKRKIKK